MPKQLTGPNDRLADMQCPDFQRGLFQNGARIVREIGSTSASPKKLSLTITNLSRRIRFGIKVLRSRTARSRLVSDKVQQIVMI